MAYWVRLVATGQISMPFTRLRQSLTSVPRSSVLLLLAALTCATSAHAEGLIDPQKLKDVTAPTCLLVDAPLFFVEQRGLLKVLWTFRLERGPYVAEKADEKGTFYRGSPGAISLSAHRKAEDSHEFGAATFDGGIYVPNDSAETPKLYEYVSGDRQAVVTPPPDGATCADAGYVLDPDTQKLSIVALASASAVVGAAGSTAGAMTAHAMGHHVNVGQSAVAGAAGGLIAGAIIGAILNHEIGKISRFAVSDAPGYGPAMQALRSTVVPLDRVVLPLVEVPAAAPVATEAAPSR